MRIDEYKVDELIIGCMESGSIFSDECHLLRETLKHADNSRDD